MHKARVPLERGGFCVVLRNRRRDLWYSLPEAHNGYMYWVNG
jgi:hypothetical protein